MAKSKARREYHHGDLRRALIQAALQATLEGGLPALSLREAARRAGVSAAAPYHHFPSREALIAAIAAEGFTGMSLAMEAELAAAGPEPLDQFEAIGRGYVRYAIQNRASFQIMFAAHALCDLSLFPDVELVSARVAGLLMESVKRVGGQVPSLPMRTPSLARLAWAVTHGMAWLILDDALLGELRGESDDAMAIDAVHSLRVLIERQAPAPALSRERRRSVR